MASEHNASGQAQFLTFFLGEEAHAVSILRAREIIEYGEVTKLPNTPPSIRGVINLRGAVVPVVDLAMRFGRRAIQVTKRTCLIIVEVEVHGEQFAMGLMVDAVGQVIGLPPSDIEPPPCFGTGVRVDFLKGLGKVGKEFVLILDLDRALTEEELLSVADAPNLISSTEAVENRLVPQDV